MSQDEAEELTPEELEAEAGAQLPDSEVLGALEASAGLPVNATDAGSVLADGSFATADADGEEGGS